LADHQHSDLGESDKKVV